MLFSFQLLPGEDVQDAVVVLDHVPDHPRLLVKAGSDLAGKAVIAAALADAVTDIQIVVCDHAAISSALNSGCCLAMCSAICRNVRLQHGQVPAMLRLRALTDDALRSA